MKILAVDSSAATASVALLDDGIITGELSLTNGLTHSQTLLPMVDTLLKSLGLKCEDIDAFACASRPGSFTGLRIGIGTIKGLAYGVDKGAIGVCTLDALAQNVRVSDCIIAPIMDARRNQVYNALYKNENGQLRRIAEPRALSVDKLAEEITQRTIFVGDGVRAYRDILTEKLGDRCILAPPNMLLQSAASIAVCASAHTPEDPALLSAMYLRKPQAEREREQKQKNLQ